MPGSQGLWCGQNQIIVYQNAVSGTIIVIARLTVSIWPENLHATLLKEITEHFQIFVGFIYDLLWIKPHRRNTTIIGIGVIYYPETKVHAWYTGMIGHAYYDPDQWIPFVFTQHRILYLLNVF
jgi:hypothetical protein